MIQEFGLSNIVLVREDDIETLSSFRVEEITILFLFGNGLPNG